MATKRSEQLDRPPNPSPRQILERMEHGEPYTAGELLEDFACSRWTIQRRLERLRDMNQIEKKKHDTNRVSWWIPYEG